MNGKDAGAEGDGQGLFTGRFMFTPQVVGEINTGR